jgi:short subunit fatty acids transporter
MNARYITWNGARWVVVDAANNNLWWSQGIVRLWSSLAVAAGMTSSLRPMTDGTGNSIVIHNANTQVMYKYTFTMATTFTAGSIANSTIPPGGQWWIKS